MRQLTLLALVSTLLLPLPARAAVELAPVFDNGLALKSADGEYAFTLGGRLFSDWSFLDAGDSLTSEEADWGNGHEFRAAWLEFGGRIVGRARFKAQYGMETGKALPKDVWVALDRVPLLGTITVGHYKQPLSLEWLTPGTSTTFMERSLLTDLFWPGRDSGIKIGDRFAGEAGTWTLSGFFPSDEQGHFYGDEKLNLAGRLTWAPVMEPGRVVHLGLSYAALKPSGDAAVFDAKPEMHLAPVRLLNLSVESDDVGLAGLEGAVVFDSIRLQAEYVTARVSLLSGGTATLSGYYLQASWLVNGETWGYKNGQFGRVVPATNFGPGRGTGEASVRWSTADLTDGPLTGGTLSCLTTGFTWYLAANVRVMLNSVFAETEADGTASGVTVRFQGDY